MDFLFLAIAVSRAPQASEWWDRDWAYRRRFSVRNETGRALAAGAPLLVEIEAAFLGIDGKSRSDGADWRIVHRGRPVPAAVLTARGPGLRLLAFRAPVEIPVGAADAAFALYFGGPAGAVPADPRDIFDVWEDFTRSALPASLTPDPDVATAVADGVLSLTDVGTHRTETTPGRIGIQGVNTQGAFEVAFDLDFDATTGILSGFALLVELDQDADEPSTRRARDLAAKLGDDASDVREEATVALIRMGPPAIGAAAEASLSADPEVRSRAARVLREIRERHGASRFGAGARAEPGRAFLEASVGASRVRLPWQPGRIIVRRDADGDVAILWKDRLLIRGSMPGRVRRIAFEAWKTGDRLPGRIRIDNLTARPYVDDRERPASTVEVEEQRP